MDELLEHIIKIEIQKTELKINDYEEYMEKMEGEEKEILERILSGLNGYLKELRRLQKF